MVGGDRIHPGPAGGSDRGQRPDLVAGGVEPEHPLVALEVDRRPDVPGSLGALANGPGREAVAQPGGQFRCSGDGRLDEQPVGGEDDEPRVAHPHEHHEDEVGRMVRGERRPAVLGRPGGRHLVTVVAGCLVAVVTVGDEHRLGPHQPGDPGRDGLVRQRPHPAPDAEMVGGLDRGLAGHGGVEHPLHLAVGVGVQAEHLTEVGPAGPGEEQTVLLGTRHRLLVGMDVAGAESLQADAGHDAAADVPRALDLELLMVDVKDGRRLLHDHPLLAPVAQEAGGPGVLVAPLVVPRLLAVELQADDVGGVLFVEPGLQGGVDDVVGGRDDLGQGADVRGVVAEAAKGRDGGHGEASFRRVSGIDFKPAIVAEKCPADCPSRSRMLLPPGWQLSPRWDISPRRSMAAHASPGGGEISNARRAAASPAPSPCRDHGASRFRFP